MSEQPLRRTPLYEEHKKLGGRIVPFAGWEMPVQYAGISAEHQAVRTAAGIFDVCHMGELFLRGEHARAVVNYLVTGDVMGLAVGQARYTCACNDGGTILDDLIVYRTGEEEMLVVCNASNRDKIVGVFQKASVDHCDFADESDKTALIALQGPKAFAILAGLGGEGPGLAALGSFHFKNATLAGVPCRVARTGYTGEDGVEIFCPWNDSPQLFRALMEVGTPLGLLPAGLGARDTLRLEARLSLYGNDIDETTNPLEAGLGWIVKMDKGDFVGRAALEKVKAAGLSRKLVGFEVTGRGIARHGYPLRDLEGKEVGLCTSGSPAPTVGKNIGLGYLPAAMAAIGTKFFVDCRGKNIEAVVVPVPFYKAKKA